MKPYDIVPIAHAQWNENLAAQIIATREHPPNLRLTECCAKCMFGRPDGLSVECKKFCTNGISLYAVCDDYQKS